MPVPTPVPAVIPVVPTVVMRRAVLSGSIVHAGAEACACDEQQGSTELEVANHSMLQIEAPLSGALWRPPWKSPREHLFQSQDHTRLRRGKASTAGAICYCGRFSRANKPRATLRQCFTSSATDRTSRV